MTAISKALSASDIDASAPADRSAVDGRAGLDALLSRQSRQDLAEPAPNDTELGLIFDAAMRAPDHGRLRPWRFLLIRGDARRALGETLAACLAARDPAASTMMLDRYRAAPLSAPLLVAIVAEITPDAVPEMEQLLAVGAATMNVLNALHALGFGGMWVTGASCYDPAVSAALGLLETQKLLGFLYIGTPSEDVPAAKRRPSAPHVADWRPSPSAAT